MAQVVQVHRGRDGYDLQMPQHSLDLFQNCAFLSMMNSKSIGLASSDISFLVTIVITLGSLRTHDGDAEDNVN